MAKITYLGGAQEVGRSCCLIETDKHNIIIDCGIKVGESEPSERYPNLNYLVKNNIEIHSILITHAHMDHSGYLPKLTKMYPAADIYITEATMDLIYTMLSDNIHLMEMNEAEVPVYNTQDLEHLMSRVKIVKNNYKIRLGAHVIAKYLVSGHILGAAAIILFTSEGNILYTGDYTTEHSELLVEETFSGYIKNRDIKIKTMISEGTYGDKVHKDRSEEINSFLDEIEITLKNGGKVLIPAFALGRSQEISLILRKFIKKSNKKYPIYLDGMAKSISQTYTLHPDLLRGQYAAEVLKGKNPFNNDIIQLIGENRRKLLKDDIPCIFISSSGMLSGGPSVYYAKKMISNPSNLIAIIGYQDEESPGHKLLSIVNNTDTEKETQGPAKTIELDGQEYPVLCKVKQFSFSGHVDMPGIIKVIGKINPEELHLIHGEKETLEKLKNSIENENNNLKVEIPDIN